MKTVFADTFYWIALCDPQDNWHKQTKEIGKSLGQISMVTTDSVLIEFVNFFSACGNHLRQAAVQVTHQIMNNPSIEVMPQSRDLLNEGLILFNKRLDKRYSLTDCISMVSMRKNKLTDVLTHDRHFEQEGFVLLL